MRNTPAMQAGETQKGTGPPPSASSSLPVIVQGSTGGAGPAR
ncbi:MAG: hypothetical protein R3E96_16175 [Planctomycetota bacterium]